MIISEQYQEQLFLHATLCYPEECCGALAVNADQVVERYYLCDNVATVPRRSYSFDAVQQYNVLNAIAYEGLSWVTYHSHPTQEAEPSFIDHVTALRMNFLSRESLHVVIGFEKRLRMRAFRIGVTGITEVPLEVC